MTKSKNFDVRRAAGNSGKYPQKVSLVFLDTLVTEFRIKGPRSIVFLFLC